MYINKFNVIFKYVDTLYMWINLHIKIHMKKKLFFTKQKFYISKTKLECIVLCIYTIENNG